MNWSRFLKRFSKRRVEVFADFIDPFSYIGFHNLWQAAKPRGIDLVWNGFEFSTDTPTREGYALATQENSDLRAGMWASVRDFAERSGLRLSEPQSVFNTRRAQRMAVALPVDALTNELLLSVFAAYFEDGKNIDDVGVLKDLITAFPRLISVGWPSLESESYCMQFLVTNRQKAEAKKFAGLPGFIFEGETHFGALPVSAWENIFEHKPIRTEEMSCSTR